MDLLPFKLKVENCSIELRNWDDLDRLLSRIIHARVRASLKLLNYTRILQSQQDKKVWRSMLSEVGETMGKPCLMWCWQCTSSFWVARPRQAQGRGLSGWMATSLCPLLCRQSLQTCVAYSRTEMQEELSDIWVCVTLRDTTKWKQLSTPDNAF